MDAFHTGEVDQQTIVTQAFARDVVATSSYRYNQSVLPRKFHTPDNICSAKTASNERWPLVDHPVPHFPRGIVDSVAWLNYTTSNILLELLKSGIRKHRRVS